MSRSEEKKDQSELTKEDPPAHNTHIMSKSEEKKDQLMTSHLKRVQP